MAALDNRKQLRNVIKVIENVINEFDRRRKSYRDCFPNANVYRFCQVPLCCYVLSLKKMSIKAETAEQCTKSVQSTANKKITRIPSTL